MSCFNFPRRSVDAFVTPWRVRNHSPQAWVTGLSIALAHLGSLELARRTHFDFKFSWAFTVGSGALLQRLARDDRVTRRFTRAIDKCCANICAREKYMQARLRRGQAKRRYKQQRRRERKEGRPGKSKTPPTAPVTPSARPTSSTTVPNAPRSAAAAERAAFFARRHSTYSGSQKMSGPPKT